MSEIKNPTLPEKALALGTVYAERGEQLFLQDAGKYKPIDLKDLVESVSLQYKDEKPYVYRNLRHKLLGVIISPRGEADYREALKTKICVRDESLMKPCDIHVNNMVIQENTKQCGKLCYGITEDYNLITANYNRVYKVVDGQIVELKKAETYVTYDYDYSCARWVKNYETFSYYSKETARFFNVAQVEGEEPALSFGDALCLNDTQKSQVTDLMKYINKKLEEIGVDLYYNQDAGKLIFLRNESNLPKGYHFEGDQPEYSDEPSKLGTTVPFEAFFIPSVQIKFDYFNGDYMLWCKKDKKLPKIT